MSTDRARGACRPPRNLSGIAAPFGETPWPALAMKGCWLDQRGLDGPSGLGVGGRAQSSPLKKTGAVKQSWSHEKFLSLCIGPPPTRREPRDEPSSTSVKLSPAMHRLCPESSHDPGAAFSGAKVCGRPIANLSLLTNCSASNSSIEKVGMSLPFSYCYELQPVRRLENVATRIPPPICVSTQVHRPR
jgi:hypothetical protein